MIRDITIGQYYANTSIVHELDPRTKLMGVLVYVFTLFLVKNPFLYFVYLGIVVCLYYMSKVPFSFMMTGLKGIIVLLIFTFCFRLICTPGTVVAQLWIFQITSEGIIKAVSLTSRIALMILGASLLSYTTTPKEMSDGMEKAFSGLERFHVPVHDMAVIVMIAFRFIPILLEEINVLMDAQAARGVEFEKCSIWKKCKNVLTLLMPLFLSTVRRSSDLAMAMEARGYSGDKPVSKMYPLVYKKNDKIAYIGMCIFALVMIFFRVYCNL